MGNSCPGAGRVDKRADEIGVMTSGRLAADVFNDQLLSIVSDKCVDAIGDCLLALSIGTIVNNRYRPSAF